MKVDFTGVTEGFPVIPNGVYSATLLSVSFITDSKKAKGPYYKLEFVLSEGEFSGQHAWLNSLSILPQSLWSLKRALVNLGVEPEDLEGEIDTDNISGMFQERIGDPCSIVVEEEEYEKKPSSKVTEILPADVALLPF